MKKVNWKGSNSHAFKLQLKISPLRDESLPFQEIFRGNGFSHCAMNRKI